MGIELLPDGFIGGFPSSRELNKCPWFWNSNTRSWHYRPDFIEGGYLHQDLIDSDPLWTI
jgi:hypothetical protein